ncbi:MAG TPA: biotin/lipoyl-binding protein, partial [Candidatus Limnocylindrales bacterium]
MSQTAGAKYGVGRPYAAPLGDPTRETFMRLKILAIVVMGVVGVGAAFVAVGGLPASAASTTRYLTGAVATGDVTDDVAATGSVASSASYGVSFGALAHLAGATAASGSGSGSTTWRVTALKVKVGDTVKKGAVLATADTTDLKRQLTDANASVY